MLSADTNEGQRLRQNSPFAGVRPVPAVWEIKAHRRRFAVIGQVLRLNESLSMGTHAVENNAKTRDDCTGDPHF